MNRSTQRRNDYIRGYPLPTATAPPLIAPGIVCPKCKGPMLDERQGKRSDKSPDYTCANMLCVSKATNGKSYRTSIWAEKPSPAVPPFLHNAAAEDAEELAGKIGQPEKPKLTKLYLDATEFVLDKIVPRFEEKEIGLTDTAVAAMIATVFIAASKER